MKTQTQSFNILPSSWYLANNPSVILTDESLHMRIALNLNSKFNMASRHHSRIKNMIKFIIKYITDMNFNRHYDFCNGHGFS